MATLCLNSVASVEAVLEHEGGSLGAVQPSGHVAESVNLGVPNSLCPSLAAHISPAPKGMCSASTDEAMLDAQGHCLRGC